MKGKRGGFLYTLPLTAKRSVWVEYFLGFQVKSNTKSSIYNYYWLNGLHEENFNDGTPCAVS